jgi:tetratricopeptide (TPR) repeat protein
MELRCKLLLLFSDIYDHSQNKKKAIDYAMDGEYLADNLIHIDRSNSGWLTLGYAAASRVGTLQEEDRTPNSANTSLQEFRKAQNMADAAVAINIANPELLNPHLLNQGVAHRQIGDALSDVDDAKVRKEAQKEYEKSLAIISALVSRDPETPQWRGELASVEERLGLFLLRNSDLEGADRHLRSALGIRDTLVRELPKNEIFLSNLAASHADMAALDDSKGDLIAALREYDKAIDEGNTLTGSDQNNFLLKIYLIRIYQKAEGLLGRYTTILQYASDDWLRARTQESNLYSYEGALCQILASHDPKNPAYGNRLRSIAEKLNVISDSLADYYIKRGQLDVAVEKYRLAVDGWDKVRTAQTQCSDCVARIAEIEAKIGDALLKAPKDAEP